MLWVFDIKKTWKNSIPSWSYFHFSGTFCCIFYIFGLNKFLLVLLREERFLNRMSISAVLSLIWNVEQMSTPFRKFIPEELHPTLLSGNAKKLLLHIHWAIGYLEITWDLRTNSPGLEAHLCHYVAIYMWKSYISTGFLSSTWKWGHQYLL